MNTEEAWIIREQNTLRCAERRGEVAPDERIQDREIMLHTKEHQESGVHCDSWVQRWVRWKSFKDKSTAVSFLQWNKYASFAKPLNGKMKQQRVVLPPYIILLKISDSKGPTFLIRISFYNVNFAFTSMVASLAENTPTGEQLAKAREGMYTFHVQGTIRHRFGTLLLIQWNTWLRPVLRFDIDIEVQANLRCWIVDGEIVATIQHVLSQVNSFVEML